MIRINIDEMDRLIEVFIRLRSDADNTLGKTTMLRNEMLDDPEFMASPKSEGIVEVINGIIDNLNQLNEDICTVEGLFNNAKEDFTSNESELIKAIDEISNKIDSIKGQLDATISSNQVVVVDRSEELRPVNEVEKLVAGNVTDLESVNIAALKQYAVAEAEAKKIEDK